MEIILIVTIAVVIDLIIGDPPDAIHPVAWMGKVISLLEKAGLKLNSPGQFIYGTGMTLFMAALFITPVFFLLVYLHNHNQVAYIIVAGVLLKLMFSIRGLRRAALRVKTLIQDKKERETRYELRALVSRDTQELSGSQIVSAATESVAEGTCDSLVAPLFYFMILGVPGAIGYRVVNTLDSMIGYHGKYEYLGKFAARLDDILNFIPARLASLLIILAAASRKTGRFAWRTAWLEHRYTESPNAGWPIAAMAGALRVRLEKPGHYRLGEAVEPLNPKIINGAVTLFSIAALAWILICLMGGGIQFAITA
jgi:adenosylcobinamide-phosphate synthase